MVKRPTVPTGKLRTLQPKQVRALLVAARGHRFHPFLVLVATTGLRRGEALALRWSDVDLKARTVKVERSLTRAGGELTFGEPKTSRGRRVVSITPGVVRILRDHRRQQSADRLALGAAWTDLDLVFASEAGTPLEPRNVSRWYSKLAKSKGVEDRGMHALRHTVATMMLDADIPVRTVADQLGHADVAMTLNVYAGNIDGHLEKASAAVAKSLGL
jgi:integrase